MWETTTKTSPSGQVLSPQQQQQQQQPRCTLNLKDVKVRRKLAHFRRRFGRRQNKTKQPRKPQEREASVQDLANDNLETRRPARIPLATKTEADC